MTSAGKTLITIATYNEIENLPALVDEIFRVAEDVDILVIDDNSPDGTGSWCDARGAEDPRLKCLHRAGKLGLGTATIAAMQYAIDHDYEFMLNMDADFSHHPRYLPALRACMQGDSARAIDVAIGSRYVPGGGVEGWPWRRRMMSWGVNLYCRWLLWLSPHDCSGAFRCYRVAPLRRLDFTRFWSRGYSFQEEMLWRLRRLGCCMVETPITFADRVKGQSKINGREAVMALAIIFGLGVFAPFIRVARPGG